MKVQIQTLLALEGENSKSIIMILARVGIVIVEQLNLIESLRVLINLPLAMEEENRYISYNYIGQWW